MYSQLTDAKLQLKGQNYSRIAFFIDADVESEETFALVDEIKEDLAKYYDGAMLVGEPTVSYDLFKTFSSDNLKISIMTIFFVLVILLMTFKVISTPILLVLVIQGSIWINFAIPVLTETNLFFFTYLIVSAIQMGATIDYAIVITSRYESLRKEMSKRDAAAQALSRSFPTIITSGAIMTIAGFLIGFMVKAPIISSIGLALGRGTLISVLSVMFILPSILILFDGLIEKTAFKLDIVNSLGLDSVSLFKKRVQIVFSDMPVEVESKKQKKQDKDDFDDDITNPPKETPPNSDDNISKQVKPKNKFNKDKKQTVIKEGANYEE